MKKITALCFLLVAMLSMSLAHAQDYTYKWEVLTGKDSTGTEVWTEVSDPLGAGIEVQSLSKIRVVFDGVYQVASSTSGYLYLEDASTKVYTLGSYPSVSATAATGLKTTVTYDVTAMYSTPNQPFTQEGSYFLIIPENSYTFYATEADYKASPKVYTKNADTMGLALKVSNDYMIGQKDATIDLEPTSWVKTFPEEFNVTINNVDVTSVAIADASKIALFAGKNKKSDCEATVSEDGKTINIKVKTLPTSGSTLYIALQAGALTLNGDKTNDHIMFGPYVLPSSTSVRDIYPAKNGKVTTMDSFYVYVGSKTGTYSFDESNPAILKYYNETSAAWEEVSKFNGVQIDDPMTEIGTEYITIKYTPAEVPAEGFAYGKYQISIPEKSFFYEKPGTSSVSAYYIKSYTADYEYAAKPEVTLDPVWSIENGATYENLTEVYVTFAGATSVATVSTKPIQLSKKIGNTYSYTNNLTCDKAVLEGGKIKLTFSEAVAQEGEYKITLPAGAMCFEGFADVENNASEISFKINSNALVKPSNVTISPAVGEISEIPATFTITLSDANITSVEVGTKEEWVGYDENWDSIYETVPLTAYFKSVDGYTNYEYSIAVDESDCKKITFTKGEGYGEFDATKEYYFEVPAGSLIINKNVETGEYLTNDDLQLGSYYAPYEFVWEVRTGVDANGADVWTKVEDPLGVGAKVEALDKMRLTVNGAYEVKASWDAYAYLYNSDLETKAITNGVTKTVSGNQIVFDITGAYYTPDKPYTVEGTYCLMIAENKIEIFKTEADKTNKVSTKNEDVLACFIEIDNSFLVDTSSCTIDKAAGWYKEFPTEFVITLNNDEIVKTAVAEGAKVGIYSSSTLKSACDVVVSEDGKTLTLTTTTPITSSGDFYLWVLANSLTFNDDVTKTNNHLKFGPYTNPSSTSINEILPKAGGNVSKLDKFTVNVRKSSGTYLFNENVPAVLNIWNESTAAWEKVCDLVGTQIESSGYVTAEYTLAETPEAGLAYGKYQVSIPEKSFFVETVSSNGSVSASYNKAYTAEYTLAEPPVVSLNPEWSIADGAEFELLSELYVTFEGITTADYNSMNAVQVFKNIGGYYNYVADANCAEYDYNVYKYVVNVEEGGKIKLTFSNELKQEGEYKVVFPKGALTFEGFVDVENNASEISFRINSKAPIRPSNVVVTPAPGGITEFPAEFTMTIDNDDITSVEVGTKEVFSYDTWDYETVPATATFKSADLYGSVTCEYDITVDADDCKTIRFTKSANNATEFVPELDFYLEIPGETLLVNKNAETGEYLTNDDLEIGLYSAPAVEITPSVEDEIYSVKDFVITANTALLTYVGTEELMPIVNYEDPEFGMISPIVVTVSAVEGTTNQFVISTGIEAKQQGNYTLYIPAGVFLYNGDASLPVAEIQNVYTVVAEPIDEVTTTPAQGDLDINSVGGTFRAVNVLFAETVKPNPDFNGAITLAIDGVEVSSVNKYSSGELENELGIIFPDKFVKNGTYVVTVPRGAAIYLDGRESSSQVFTWNVTGGYTPGEGITVDPEEGVVESLSIVSLTFNEYEVVGKNVFYTTSALGANGNILLRDAQDNIVAECSLSELTPSELGYNSLEVHLCEPGTFTGIEITEPGTYTMTVPAGIVNFNKSGANPCDCGECNACTTSLKGTGNGNYNKELTFTWTILGPAELVATPADGSIVESLVNIVLEWQGAQSVVVDPAMMVGGAKLYKEVEGSDNEFVSDMICSPIGEGSNTAVIDILSIPTEQGTYIIEIPAGMFTVDGEAWEAVALTYIMKSTEVTLEEIGETRLAKFRMTVDPCETIEVNAESVDKITLAYLVDGITEVGTYEVDNITSPTADLTLTATTELADGNYVVWIPEGYFLFDGKPCADIKVYYDDVIMSGIYGISLDAKDLNIYSVNGMLIKRNGSISDLNELEPGIYIINGKKVMIK